MSNVSISRFLPFVLVQCSIALAAVNRLGEKLSPKNEISSRKSSSNTWLFLYPDAMFFSCTGKGLYFLLTFVREIKNKCNGLRILSFEKKTMPMICGVA